MADKAKEEMLDNFIGITGVEKDRAKFYLESAAWNLELAMASFYEGDQDDEDDTAGGVHGTSVDAPPPRVEAPSGSGGGVKRSGATRAAKSTKFATIGSMRDDSSDSEGDEQGQAFYAGGSEHSGQQVLGPKKKKNIVEDLFKSAKEHGAEEVQGEEASSRGPSQRFMGSGYRLGDTEELPSERIPGAPTKSHKKQVDCVLKLWKDGFSVDDGPLRDFKDPQNRDFLAAISKGEVPNELIREAKGGEVNLNMEDHRQENYVKPKVALRAFSGEGHTLGSPAPTVVTATVPVPTSTRSAAGSSTVKVDEAKPVTTLQIRLADGQKLISKFNHSHKVSDIRSHIASSCPQYAGANYVLQTTFPNRELTNETETLEQAKLLNAVVVQRMK